MRASLAFASIVCTLSTVAVAQEDRCIFFIEHIGNQGTTQETTAGTNYFAGGGVRLLCRGTTIRMESDSVASYRGGEITYFIGNVRYRDSAMTLDTDHGTWFQEGARWEARGNVFTRNLETGSTLTGPYLDWFRPQEGVRDEAAMFAIGRPRIEYAVADSAGSEEEPYIIVADRVRMIGDDRLWAGGTVTIDRSDFAGRSDSLWLDSGEEGRGALIDGRPVIEGVGDNPYRLTGERIDLELQDKVLHRVVSQDSAHAVNDEWDLVADTIAIRLEDEAPEHIDAWGAGRRPVAQSEAYVVEADSIALAFPGGQLSNLNAVGDAMLETAFDSVTGERDWLAGDTVVATFVAPDSGDGGTALEQLEARSEARSFRQMRPADDPTARPSLNYVVGDLIVITMKLPPADGVERVDVFGQVQGVQLEPTAAAVAPVRPDSVPTPQPEQPAGEGVKGP